MHVPNYLCVIFTVNFTVKLPSYTHIVHTTKIQEACLSCMYFLGDAFVEIQVNKSILL